MRDIEELGWSWPEYVYAVYDVSQRKIGGPICREYVQGKWRVDGVEKEFIVVHTSWGNAAHHAKVLSTLTTRFNVAKLTFDVARLAAKMSSLDGLMAHDPDTGETKFHFVK